jgi:hypothetical protein
MRFLRGLGLPTEGTQVGLVGHALGQGMHKGVWRLSVGRIAAGEKAPALQ